MKFIKQLKEEWRDADVLAKALVIVMAPVFGLLWLHLIILLFLPLIEMFL